MQSESLRSATLGLCSLCWQCSVKQQQNSVWSAINSKFHHSFFFFFFFPMALDRKIPGMSSAVNTKATLKKEIFPTGICIFQQLMVKISFSRSAHILLKIYDCEMQTQIAVRFASHSYLPAGMCVCKSHSWMCICICRHGVFYITNTCF